MAVTYLLLPIDSIACHGGPMKVRPASVHFLANVGFSLSYGSCQRLCTLRFVDAPYKAIARMYTLAALLLCNLYYPVSIEIC